MNTHNASNDSTTTTTTTQFWFFNDAQGRWHGPFDTAQMQLWCRAGYFSPSVVLRNAHGTELRSVAEIALFADAFRSNGTDNVDDASAAGGEKEKTGSSSAVQWCYKDPNGHEQGPFTSAQIGTWIVGGFFSRTTLVRREDEEGFRTLGNVFEFSAYFDNGSSGNGSSRSDMAAGGYVAAAQFDAKGHFRKTGVLNAHASQGLVASDGEYNVLVKTFDVERYQEEMRKKKARLADPNQSLRANQTRYEKAKQEKKQNSK
jgi:hypothetical protein